MLLRKGFPIRLNFCSYLPNQRRPYLIGGLPNAPKLVSAPIDVVSRLFPSTKKEDYIYAYRNTLQMFSDSANNQASLEQLLFPGLLPAPTNLQLHNEDAPVQMSLINLYMALGCTFLRKPPGQFSRISGGYEWYNFYMRDNLMSAFMDPSQGFRMKMLIGINIAFRSKMKLLPKGTPNNQTEQWHTFQFEAQSELNMEKLQKMDFSNIGKGLMQYDKMANLYREMLGTDYVLKIGDMDGYLRGNMNCPSK